MTDEASDWLARLYEDNGATLHRLSVLLGAGQRSGSIVRSALLALRRRANRLVDPRDRVHFLQEQVVHLARALRPTIEPLDLPHVDEPRQQELLSAVGDMTPRDGELLVVSHYLSVFGPELAGIMRMTVRRSNAKLEAALEELASRVDAPGPGSEPGVIESLSQELTAALRSAARLTAAPAVELPEEELDLLAEEQGTRFQPRLVVLLTVFAVIVGMVLASLMREGETAAVAPPPLPSVTPTAVASRSIHATVRNTPLYYVANDWRLYRELRDLPSSGNLVYSALNSLLTLVPQDPDYRTVWSAGKLHSAEIEGSQLVVDLSEDAYEDLTSPVAIARARDQVIYTAAELVGDPDLRVVFRADGGAAPDGFNDTEGYARTGLEPMPAVWISSPRNQAQLSAGQSSIIGTVKEGVGVPIIRITDQESGDVVLETSAQTTEGVNVEGWRVWTVTTNLPRGSYDITVSVIDGDPPAEVSENKAVTVS